MEGGRSEGGGGLGEGGERRLAEGRSGRGGGIKIKRVLGAPYIALSQALPGQLDCVQDMVGIIPQNTIAANKSTTLKSKSWPAGDCNSKQ